MINRIFVEYEEQNGTRVNMILPEEQGFQEAKDLLAKSTTKLVYLKSEGSRIKWFMAMVDQRYILNGKMI